MRHSKILERHSIVMILLINIKMSPIQSGISRIRSTLVCKIKGRKMTIIVKRFLSKMFELMSEPACLFSLLLYS